ncbi:glycoside hydrolase family 2 protein, partial [Streptomyces sp. NPDC059627]
LGGAQRRGGAAPVVWPPQEGWAVTSGAAIDGDGREKPLWHELRRLYADRLLTLQVRERGLVLAAVNQGAEAWHGEATLRRMTVDGVVLGSAGVALEAEARAVAVVDVPAELRPDGPKEFLVADGGGLRALYFPAPDREIPYLEPEFEVTVAPGAVTVAARTLVRDLLLQADRLAPAARADRGLVTLLPGERVTIGVTGWKTPDVAAARAALYCVEPSR